MDRKVRSNGLLSKYTVEVENLLGTHHDKGIL